MNLLAKVLVGAAVVAGVGTVIAVATSVEKENPVVDGHDNVVAFQDKDGNITSKEDASVLKRIKRFVKRKVVKFLAWVTMHMEQIEAIGAVIGLASAGISISSATRDLIKGYETDRKLEEIKASIEVLNQKETDRVNNLGKYINEFWNATDNNMRIVDDDVRAISEKFNVVGSIT